MTKCKHERQPDLPCAWPECPESIPEDHIEGTHLVRCGPSWNEYADDGTIMESDYWEQEWWWMEPPP